LFIWLYGFLVEWNSPDEQNNQINKTNQINQMKEGAAAPGMTEPGLPWR